VCEYLEDEKFKSVIRAWLHFLGKI
jgi:hypothetical protein